MPKGLTYGQFVGAHMDCVQADLSRVIWGSLTPLHGVVAPGITSLPGDIRKQLQQQFWSRHESNSDWQSKIDAQAWLQTEVETFKRERLHLAFDDVEIRDRARRWADLCSKMMVLEVMQEFAESVGVKAPQVGKRITREGAAKRLQCERWWRRAMRRSYTRQAESHMRAAGFVHKHRQVYASDRCVSFREQRKRADRELLQSLVAVSDAGEQLELWDLVQASQANPTLRRNELMTRLAGFEEIAAEHGDVAEFITLTCPSAYHRTLVNGSQNPRWQGFTPREGQQWLCKMWARARAKLQRISVLFYGFRVAEPNHDGTPHWHMVLFTSASGAASLRQVLAMVWMSEYGKEAGALIHRYKFKRIDPAKGSAAGYLAKYIAKNIDGYKVGADHETADKDASESCDRVQAWASAHGIRQFQQLGGPSVSLWRELRRLRVPVADNAPLEAARKAASDESDWAGFVAAAGGIRVGRLGAIGLLKETTGEVSQYGELKAPQIVGVQSACGSVRTREKVWRIERKGHCESSGGQLTRAASSAETARSAPPSESSTQVKTRGTGEVRRHAAVDLVARGESAGMRQPAEVIGSDRLEAEDSAACTGADAGSNPARSRSYLGPVSITVRGTSRGIDGEGSEWPPWTQ